MGRFFLGGLLLCGQPLMASPQRDRIRQQKAEANRAAAQTAVTQPGEAGTKARAKASAESETLFQEAAKSGDAPAATITAQTALVLGDPKTAVARADAAVGIASAGVEAGRSQPAELIDAQRTRAVARWHGADYPGAQADAREVLRAAPGDPVANAVDKLSADRVSGRIQGLGGTGEEANLQELVALAGELGGEGGGPPARLAEAVRHLKEGEKALQEGKYLDMHRLATAALKLVPSNPRAYMQRAFANLFLGRHEATVADATLGLALEKDSPELLGLRARGLNELGRHQAAFRDADRAVGLDAQHAMGWMERGRAREGLKEAGDGWLADFKRAAELRPDWGHFYDEALARSRREGMPTGSAPLAGAPSSGVKVLAAGLGLLALLGVLVLAARRSQPAPIVLSAPPEAAPPAAGARPGERYVRGRVLGQGGMGKVYEAKDTVLSRQVAIKEPREELKSNAEDLRRFLEEAKTVASLAHPNIVAIYDVVEEGPYLVFELVQGKTLREVLEAAGGKLDAVIVKRVLEQACAALDHAHSRKVVHRDLKPSNIMLNDGLGVKVMDFGISRVAKDSLMRTTATVAGTPLYMAPEQEAGKAQRETDLYALAICAHEMLTGFVPFDGPAQLELKRQGRMAKGAFSGKLEAFFKRALEPEPAARFHSGAELLAAFSDAVG